MDGRWIGRDPIGEKDNNNRYIFNKNKIYLFDYLGLNDIIIVGGVADIGSHHDQTAMNFYLGALEAFKLIKKGIRQRCSKARILTFYFEERYRQRSDWPEYKKKFIQNFNWGGDRLFEYNSKKNLLTLIKDKVSKIGDKKICRLFYYGHSTATDLLLDYNESNTNGNTENLTAVELATLVLDINKNTNRMSFINAGCNGAEFCKLFTTLTKQPSLGADKAVNYKFKSPKAPLPPPEDNGNYHLFQVETDGSISDAIVPNYNLLIK